MNPIIREITAGRLITDRDHFKVGDGVKVHVKVREGDKERIQIFSGIVIAKKHAGISATFTVRRMIAGEGVERIFPVHSPSIARIEVERESVPMRAKLYYIRQRVGKDAMKVREKKR
jgi:large subunit ribosomal protein L19